MSLLFKESSMSHVALLHAIKALKHNHILDSLN